MKMAANTVLKSRQIARYEKSFEGVICHKPADQPGGDKEQRGGCAGEKVGKVDVKAGVTHNELVAQRAVAVFGSEKQADEDGGEHADQRRQIEVEILQMVGVLGHGVHRGLPAAVEHVDDGEQQHAAEGEIKEFVFPKARKVG